MTRFGFLIPKRIFGKVLDRGFVFVFDDGGDAKEDGDRLNMCNKRPILFVSLSLSVSFSLSLAMMIMVRNMMVTIRIMY